MSTLFIREYDRLAAAVHDTAGPRIGSPMPQEPGVADQTVTFSATHGESAAFNSQTRYVAIIGDAAFCFLIGADPTATDANLMIPANALVFLGVGPGLKISAVAAP